MSAVERPRFYGTVAVALGVFVVVAFARTYYLRFLSPLPPLGVLLHWHGLVFTAWLAIFIVQTRLVATHRVALHMRLGFASIGLALLVILLGLVTAAVTVAEKPIRPSGLSGVEFAIVPLTTIALFAVFFALGVAFRKRAQLHKRFMVLAMIAVLAPATTRLVSLLAAREHATLIQMVVPSLFIAWSLLADWRRERRLHLVYVIGGAVVVASWPLRVIAGRSDWWQPVGEWVSKIGAILVSG